MTTKPLRKPRPITPGDFAVRANGNWIATALDEATAWGKFLSECRATSLVELLRGRTVVAWLEPS